MVVDDTFIPNPGRYFGTLAGFGIQSLTLNVIDPDFGNGTYTAADFLDVRWDTNEATLDLSQPLLGQPTSIAPFGDLSGEGGDFNLFSNDRSKVNPLAAAPDGVNNFILATNGGNGNAMQMTVFRPAGGTPVPEPGSIALLVGMASISGIMLRRRKK